MRPFIWLNATAFITFSMASVPVSAGGFYLQEQSPIAEGRAFAGEAANAESAATVFYNPAGMARLPGTNVDAGSHVLFIDSAQTDRGSTRSAAGGLGSFPTGGGNGGNPFSQPIVVPSGYLSTQIYDSRLWIGLGISAPFGVKVVYDPGWFGRYDSIRSDLKTLNIQPSAAFKINDHLSVGGGVDIQTLHADLTNALPNVSPLLPDGMLRIKGQDMAFGWNVGIMGDVGPVRLGASYRSHINHDLSGKVTISGLITPLAASNGATRGFAPISLPDIATVGAVFGTGQFRLLAGASWYNWSRFARITVENSGVTFLDSEQGYRDTYSGSAGVEYDVTPKLTLRAGSMYDQTPTKNALRTTRVPDGNRTWASGGATFHVSKMTAVNLSYAHVFVKTEGINRIDPLFSGTPAVTNISTRSTNGGNVDIIATSLALHF